ncbi:uncharacterized protein LOC123318453 [Coccinella septempunctata]|uniref:uncharacterized protein LOC123318453 n=1 Tax=Coccinella septempunctata TaxID=41139 RepID=UPI001D062B95|nr:uncharacterized protein LOC123318453 [Coccinella septempunctata]
MESSTGGLIASTPSKIPHTLAPRAMTPTSGNLTPVEYGAVGVGCVLIFALIAYIYQKYKQYTTSSAGGSYSPMTQHRNAPGRKKSNRSEGGHSTNEDGATGIEMNAINSDMVVVELATEVKTVEEVVETPITKTIVNGLQKSSSAENHDTKQSSSSTPDTIEVISEVHKPKSMEKPPRKSRTPNSSPEKFTSDKTSASNLNEDSLKTVTHAIGGILRSQVPDETENQTCGQQSNEEDSSGDSDEKGVSLIGKLVPTNSTGNNDQNINSEDVETENNTPEQEVTSDGEPLYRSLEREVDAGSEYFSADEHSDAKNSPPRSPLLKKGFEDISTRNLRAEDVYNTEIITEDGRRRSIEEDIAESIEEKKDDQFSSDTIEGIPSSNEAEIEDCSNESTQPSAPILSQEICSDFTENDCSRSETDQIGIPKEIHIKNLINTEKTNNQRYVKEEAEMIIDDILKTSQLDALTIQSIKQDLGDSESGKQRVKWSNNLENISYVSSIIDNETQDQPKKKASCDLDSFTWTEIPTDKTDETLDLEPSEEDDEKVQIQESSMLYIPEDSSNLTKEDSRNSQLVDESLDNDKTNVVEDHEEEAFPTTPDEVNAQIFDADSLSEENSSYYAQKINSPNPSPSSTNEDSFVATDQNIGSIDEGFPMEHRFEFIPPRQPQIFEDDLIVFSNSDQESISPLSNSTAEFNAANEEHLIAMSNENYQLNIDPTNASNDISEEITPTVEENVGNRTKWYVPDDEISELDLKIEADKPGGGLYIVLSEEEPKLAPVENVATPTNSRETSEQNIFEPPRKPKNEIKNFSNISYAFIEVNDDPRNEGWPEHLPKNIHSISGVGLVKTADNGSLLHNPLKEEEPEVIPSTSGYKNDAITPDSQPNTSETETTTTPAQKPIPKFIIPNMDGRLSRKKASRRRQIKSLDSGVHHYYGEYLSLAELPEIDHENEKNEIEVKQETGVIEDVLTIKPDGTITQETIVIPNSN